MMKLQTYAGCSFMAALAVICYAFNTSTRGAGGQFYPATVYLSTTKITLVILLNMGFVIMCSLWKFTKLVFLGSLREAEVERLNEQAWREATDILFTITLFRHDFSVSFLVKVVSLLFIKSFHWLGHKRVEYIETTPSVTFLSHIRIVSLMLFLFLLDSLFLYTSFNSFMHTASPSPPTSVSLFLAFEYMILATSTISTLVKYVFYIKDMLMEGQWERKAVYTFYLELIRDLLQLSMYLCFFISVFMNYGMPLHLLQEFYMTFRNFKVRVADYLRYRKITSNMNDRFPDATPEELNTSDATCIICREEMVTAKKLICGHLFHVHCLRSWLERQNTCPTCRAPVVPPENGTAAREGQHVQLEAHQQGAGLSNTSAQSAPNDAADNILGQHQARLEAASAAASVYGKSYVYPSANTLTWSQGYAFLPQMYRPLPDSVNEEFSAETTKIQTSCTNFTNGIRSGDDPNKPGSQVDDNQERFIRNQIEFLQSTLQLLQQQNTVLMDVNTAADKGKATVSSVPSASNCGPHAEGEEVNTP